MKNKEFTRRDFIKTTSAVTAGAILAPTVACSVNPFDSKGLPTTMLGKTGVRIPLIIMGLGSRFMSVDEEKGLEILETGLNKGLYYWDTAAIYKNDYISSEERIGKVLKNVRDQVFLSTKVSTRNADEAKQTVETSLKRLQTDYIDLFQIHSIQNEEDVRNLGTESGVLSVLKSYQEQGIIKHIGFTGHTNAKAMKLAAELYEFDTMLIALNHHQKGKQDFEEEPVPFAAKKEMGVLAMKVIRPRESVNGLNPDDLVKYALSLNGITAAVIGIDSVDIMQKNIDIIKGFQPLSSEKMNELHVQMQPFYKSNALPWMQPNYYDGMHWA